MRAICRTQKALKEDPERATIVGQRLFPQAEAAMIAAIVRRDLPFYDPVITVDAVRCINQFAQDIGLLAASVPYEQVVAVDMQPLWTA